MSAHATIVWFRQDLRVDDNPAFRAAAARGAAVIPLYIHAPHEEDGWPPGAASRWWLHHSLASLASDLENLGSRLVIRQGHSNDELQQLIEATRADAVFWNRRYEPAVVQRDKSLKKELRDRGLAAESFNASLLYEPWEIETNQGNPYQVFTPFWKACRSKGDPDEPSKAPRRLTAPPDWPTSVELESLELLPKIGWADDIAGQWQPGSAGARKCLDEFLEGSITEYPDRRDRPAQVGTSRLSPHLRFGEISPRQIWHAVRQACGSDRRTSEGKSAETFLSEIGWREFAYHVLYHFPKTPNRALREKFRSFPWSKSQRALCAWQKGRTGYPIVDAGMRELWSIGWMHNRVRMIVGSFLTKDLLIPWQDGAKWFWDTLVDADLANNTLNWQWVAGCGADAAPYFRVFNPVTQGKKFDPYGRYVRRWVPELADLPDKWIHCPWEAPDDALQAAGVELGDTYPRPIVDHGEAREAALGAFNTIKGG